MPYKTSVGNIQVWKIVVVTQTMNMLYIYYEMIHYCTVPNIVLSSSGKENSVLMLRKAFSKYKCVNSLLPCMIIEVFISEDKPSHFLYLV